MHQKYYILGILIEYLVKGGGNIRNIYLGVNIKECEFLGQGCEGKVYLTPDGYALKVFNNEKKCKNEYHILKAVEKSQFFPKVIKYSGRCILREYVGGMKIRSYIKKNGLSEKLSLNLVSLIEEFEKLGFKRLDIRGEHIFIQEDESIKIIDPRKSFTKEVKIPYSMIKSIDKSNELDKFVKTLVTYRPDIAIKWQNAINK